MSVLDQPGERLLTGWGRTSSSRARMCRPDDGGDLHAAVRSLEPGWIARGLGRSYGDAAQAAGGTVIDMTGLHRVLRFDPATGSITAEGGTSLRALLRLVVPAGWFPGVVPGTADVTIGGAIASDVHGKNHHVDGGFCDHVTELRLCTGAGDLLDVRPDGDSELFRATAGGMGLTGVIVSATLRLRRISSPWIVGERIRTHDLDHTFRAMEDVDGRHRYTVAWLDLTSAGSRLGRAVIDAGDHAPSGAVPGAPRSGRIRLAVPFTPPVSVVGSRTVPAFNTLHWSRSPSAARMVSPIDAFFHPLDRLRHWNRLYGPGGFVQHQCVVPLGAEDELRAIAERLSAARCPIALAVLKRLGPGRGMITFPIQGWTLAMDVPAGWPGLGPLLDEIDERVAACGGRVYLTKDARMRPELVPVMYPELDAWRTVQRRVDPMGVVRSDLSRRLALTGAAA